jgi:hypothetical protein
VDEQKELQETHQILEKTVGDLNEPTPIPSSKPKPAIAKDDKAAKTIEKQTTADKSAADSK